ncbi:6-phosphogluconolactonase (cycloisomerase 2 family) [Granulicella aggregans]|uniref:6-phosphogluconolactonase (Cycloisomerase 2 family) n=1 Tax=Granulicella aggregans TaxID=474949 RepID=A0A7W7ZHU0_9BACT|nr:beta-propeller fold lactonase family protein [Granulicella aggregans]MBB5060051.1 6-phosphogluconolactonase (cycloisomerase 2 family) [Granulicella aggregans]
MGNKLCGALVVLACFGVMQPAAHAAESGAVFVMTNAATGNQVIAYARGPEGRLQQRAIYDTEGRGGGGKIDPLQSQGALTLSPDGSRLYAVNAGSGTITSFQVQGANLSLMGHVPSGGSEPVAVTQFGNIVYVLNGAGPGDVVAFRENNAGRLVQIPDSTAYLSGVNTGGASISVRPDGKFLAVVERGASVISTFPINANGTLGPIVTTTSADPGAFSGRFAPNGVLLVTDNTPGTSDASLLSSYTISGNGTLSPISESAPTYGNGNCWSVVTPNGAYVYSDNSASSTIAGYTLSKAGVLKPIRNTIVATLPSGSTNLEVAVTADGKFLYTLNAGSGTIGIFAINSDGVLTEVADRSDGLLPSAGYEGLAAL